MKYTDEILKQHGLMYAITYDENTLAPIIIVKNSKGYFKKYKTTMISINDYNGIEYAIGDFIIELRKQKLIKLNEI